MKCEFYSTGKFYLCKKIILFLNIFLIFSFQFIISDRLIRLYAPFVILFTALTELFVISVFESGKILACKNQLIIYHKVFNKKALVSHIEYKNISCAEYCIRKSYARGISECRIFVLTVKCSDGKKRVFISEMIAPPKDPDDYNEYINNQPMMKLCRYINEKSR